MVLCLTPATPASIPSLDEVDRAIDVIGTRELEKMDQFYNDDMVRFYFPEVFSDLEREVDRAIDVIGTQDQELLVALDQQRWDLFFAKLEKINQFHDDEMVRDHCHYDGHLIISNCDEFNPKSKIDVIAQNSEKYYIWVRPSYI